MEEVMGFNSERGTKGFKAPRGRKATLHGDEQSSTSYAPGDMDIDRRGVTSRPFHTAYDGNCSDCGSAYEAGARLHYIPGHEKPVHEDCDGTLNLGAALPSVEEATELSEKEIAAVRKRLCKKCFTELPTSGICGIC